MSDRMPEYPDGIWRPGHVERGETHRLRPLKKVKVVESDYQGHHKQEQQWAIGVAIGDGEFHIATCYGDLNDDGSPKHGIAEVLADAWDRKQDVVAVKARGDRFPNYTLVDRHGTGRTQGQESASTGRQRNTEHNGESDRQRSIERQCALKAAVELAAHDKIEVAEIGAYTDTFYDVLQASRDNCDAQEGQDDGEQTAPSGPSPEELLQQLTAAMRTKSLTPDEVRDAAKERYGVEHSTDLGPDDLRDLIDAIYNEEVTPKNDGLPF